VVGAAKPKMLRVAARHADEWNMPGTEPQEWATVNGRLDDACAELGRDPSTIRRSVQLFVHPSRPDQTDAQLESIAEFASLGCEHVVLSFYQPPDEPLLRRCASEWAQ
jgi:alkanesulfonate monooxygenase SsuD/methylene tetrahydromethanopterin reductase-like flavin-dependent oxidoreductase (luciferase family)